MFSFGSVLTWQRDGYPTSRGYLCTPEGLFVQLCSVAVCAGRQKLAVVNISTHSRHTEDKYSTKCNHLMQKKRFKHLNELSEAGNHDFLHLWGSATTIQTGGTLLYTSNFYPPVATAYIFTDLKSRLKCAILFDRFLSRRLECSEDLWLISEEVFSSFKLNHYTLQSLPNQAISRIFFFFFAPTSVLACGNSLS